MPAYSPGFLAQVGPTPTPGAGGQMEITTTITGTSSPSPSPSGGGDLPRTGEPILSYVFVGLLLIGVGAATVRAFRRA